MHLGAGNGGEAALRVIQSAHSEAQTETDEPERLMKVETEKLERERGERRRKQGSCQKAGERETDEGKRNGERVSRGSS